MKDAINALVLLLVNVMIVILDITYKITFAIQNVRINILYNKEILLVSNVH